MRRTRVALAIGLAAAVAAAGLLSLRAGPARQRALAAPALARLQHEHERLHTQLEERLKAEPLVAQVEAQPGDVVLAVRTGFAGTLVREVAGRYLDRVKLDLENLRVDKDGELEAGTPFGKMKVGDWSVRLLIHHVEGVLRGGPPKVQVQGTNRVRVTLPVRVEEGHGQATLRFQWDPRSLAKLVCDDFEAVQRVQGRVLPREYSLAGSFVLDAEGGRLTARPRFADQEFRLKVELTDGTWAEVRRALEGQDRPGRCGLAMKPDDVLRKLHELVDDGFDVPLPRRLYRSVSLPAGLRESVTVADRKVELVVRPHELRVTPDIVWYAADVGSRVAEQTSR